ncbi:MAG: hypothetical protein A2W90_14410 [Bacteroidetes bacterium GWF2_42_66]|nr:MAG: hypothetical protein A2W92_15805 [Bacteroidetes bacterium GWA2_42_15]OFX99122.1 MAG: hypothetical protein A2W89_06850 [Bacteroidetes bacterium GWE2_42_39]OFY46781.1 MAG: hypothetical protein A2W90_14410 [Bacteroidetes bacterium GWF2_42_66]
MKDRQIALSVSDSNFSGQQNKTVSGKVTDSSSAPLPGVSVVIKGTTNGTITDFNGNYSLPNVPNDVTLVFSFVGMKMQEVKIAGKVTVNVKLEEETFGIEEVVAVGYGTMKKVDLTGSISQVSGEKLKNRPVTNALSALQGAASGVVVTRSTGQPGKEGYDVEIRGLSSVNGGKALILVDGAPGDITTLNPNDIESVNVLKDAAAAAIYGARAAGGVILVTTKKGVSGDITIEYNGLFGGQTPMMIPDRLHSWEEETLTNIALANAGRNADYSEADIEIMKDPNVNYIDAYWNPGKDWNVLYDFNQTEYMLRDFSPTNNHNFSLKGGNDKDQFFMSLGYYHQQGIFILGPDETSRINARFNYSRQLNKTFSLDTRMSYGQTNTLSPTYGITLLFDQLFQARSIYPIFLPESNDTKYFYHSSNPRAYPILKDGGEVKDRGDEFNGVFTLKAKDILKGLTLTAVYSPGLTGINSNGNYRTVEMWNRIQVGGRLNYPNSAIRDRRMILSNNLQFLADYDFKLGEKNTFHILGGYAYEDYRNHFVSATAKSLSSNDLFALSLGDPTLSVVSEGIQTWALLSYFGRAEYNFDDRFLLKASLRYDGSSKLAPDNRWQAFPSLSAAWRLSNESWFKGLLPIFDEFKLRASWGQLGNSDGVIGNYDYIATLSKGPDALFNNQKNTSYYQQYLASADKTWETIETSNAGLDFSILKNRLNVSADYFIKRNNNMLAPLQVSNIIGITTSTYNVADMKTWGWEVTVGWKDSPSANFSYWANLNVFDTQNKILSYDGRSTVAAGTNSIIEGMPYNSIFGYMADGYFTSTEEITSHAFQDTRTGVGDIKYRNLNDDERINGGLSRMDDHGDLVYLGNPSPRYNFGIDLGFKWKGFDFSAFLQGVGKRMMLLDARSVYPYIGTGKKPSAVHLDSWTPENLDARFPRPYFGGTHNTLVSSHWIQNTAYIRLKNLQVGYTLPQSLTKHIAISKARVYFSGQDIWEKTKMWYPYYDPENQNRATFVYPLFRTFTMGVNVIF